MFANPITSYQQISLESEVKGADPRHLITLLFDGAETALNNAQAQLAKNDFRGKSESISKAISIIIEGLSASLNLNEGGELAHNLAALYDYMVTRLVHANVRNDTVAIREVLGLLSEIGGAWKMMGTDANGDDNP
jgi:flagellar protein FliS